MVLNEVWNEYIHGPYYRSIEVDFRGNHFDFNGVLKNQYLFHGTWGTVFAVLSFEQ